MGMHPDDACQSVEPVAKRPKLGSSVEQAPPAAIGINITPPAAPEQLVEAPAAEVAAVVAAQDRARARQHLQDAQNSIQLHRTGAGYPSTDYSSPRLSSMTPPAREWGTTTRQSVEPRPQPATPAPVKRC